MSFSQSARSGTLLETDIEGYLKQHQEKELLRFVAVGSVDDGKSTLIGRLLYDTQGIYDDQLASVKKATSKGFGDEVDLSLFTDGLKAEREQGITIDVAYRYFSTEHRKFIIADTPGHVQYTRNMATGASTANVALILIDARLGVLQQSRRHAYIANLLGIPHLAVCVNKMDLVDFGEARYREIETEFRAFAERLGFKDVRFFPISAKEGDNVVHSSKRSSWYEGGTLLNYLETVPIAQDRNLDTFRYPVQTVIRPNLDYRGFAAQIASGVVKHGDPVMALPSRKMSRIKAIDTFDGELPEAKTPMSVTLRLEDEIDISRGEMLVHAPGSQEGATPPRVTQRFDAMIVWMSERPLDPAKSYLIKHTTNYVRADIEEVTHVVDLDTLNHESASALELNDIGRVRLHTHRSVFVDAYTENRSTGAFIVIDSLTNNTVGAGMILPDELSDDEGAFARGTAGQTQVSPRERSERLGHRAFCLALQGADGGKLAGVAFAVERLLFDRGVTSTVLTPGNLGDAVGVAPVVAERLLEAGLVAIVAGVRDDVLTGLLGDERVTVVSIGDASDPDAAAATVVKGLAL